MVFSWTTFTSIEPWSRAVPSGSNTRNPVPLAHFGMSHGCCWTTPGNTPLAEVALTASPPRPQLIERVRPLLGGLVPSLHLVAEGVLGADATIDFVGVEPSGRVVLVLVGNETDDLELVGRALAQRAWVEPRIRDWIQLAPNLGIRLGAGVRAVLLCSSFRAETAAAVSSLGSEVVSLARYHCFRRGAEIEILLEPLSRKIQQQATAPLPEPAALPSFRTALTDEDLGLTVDELAELE
jgi:hypothetical protein